MTTHDLALAGWQVRYTQRSFWRNRRAAFFSLVFPLLFLLVFGTLTGDQPLDSRGGLPLIDFYVPGIITYAIMLIGFNTTAMTFAALREEGILKRIRMTPLPTWAYVAGTVGSTVAVMATSVGIMLAVGIGLFGAHLRLETVPGLLVTLLLGGACLTTLGVAASRVVGKPENGMGILMVVTLPLIFVSDIYFPLDDPPAWVATLASAFPLKPLTHGLGAAFGPAAAAPGLSGGDLAVLAAWTVVGCALMRHTMRAVTRRD